MVTAIDVPQQRAAATDANAASDTQRDDKTAKNNGILTLPEQSDSSVSEDDDTVEKTSTLLDKDSAPTKRSNTSNDNNGDVVMVQESLTIKPPTQHSTRRTVTSFDIESSPSPTKKRRVHSDHQGHVWDGFVRKGARLKGFLEDAAMHLASHHHSSSTATSDNQDDTAAMRQQQSEQLHNHAADIAREKTAECMILQQKLKEAQATAATMTAANVSLREAASASNERMERTLEALKIAGTNAANARADADAAEACAASMATQLQALRDVVDETKRASQVLYKEHEQVSAGARLLETKLVQKETELARSQKEQRQWMEEREEYKKRSIKMHASQKSLETEISHLTGELQEFKHQADEYAAMEQARKDRAAMVEQELRQARSMLQEATSTATETEQTVTVLNETIASLETENKSLHETIEQLQAKGREENERLNEALTKAEKEAQNLRVKAVSQEEAIQRAKMDKSASDKQVTKLKTKVASLERRLKDATSYSALEQADEPAAESSSRRTSRGVSFSIPPLTANTPGITKGGKENSRSTTSSSAHRVTPAPKSSTCSICSQPITGFVKPCQCGIPSCNLRAHATCITKTNASGVSVSHPGTPAMRPPVLLCGNVTSNK